MNETTNLYDLLNSIVNDPHLLDDIDTGSIDFSYASNVARYLQEKIGSSNTIAIRSSRKKGVSLIYAAIISENSYLFLDEYESSNSIVRLLDSIDDISFILTDDTSFYHEMKSHSYNIILFDNPPEIQSKQCYKKDNSSIGSSAVLTSSGTTGKRKPIKISLSKINIFVEWCISQFKLDDMTKCLSTSPLSFDLSFFDIFSVPSSGGSTTFCEKKDIIFPEGLSKLIERKNITHWYTTPTILSHWLNKGNISSYNITSLKFILFAGEKIVPSTLKDLMRLLPNTKFFNLYGPTETNVCLYWEVDPKLVKKNHDIPCGIPTSYCDVMIEGNNSEGELLVKGETNYKETESWYKTGDLFYMKNHLYYFYGRKDRAFKYLGNRIQPEEIEVPITEQFPDIEFILAPKNDTINTPCAVLCIKKDSVNLSDLREFIRNNFRKSIHPREYFILDKIPRLGNSKLNIVEINKIIGDNS